MIAWLRKGNNFGNTIFAIFIGLCLGGLAAFVITVVATRNDVPKVSSPHKNVAAKVVKHVVKKEVHKVVHKRIHKHKAPYYGAGVIFRGANIMVMKDSATARQINNAINSFCQIQQSYPGLIVDDVHHNRFIITCGMSS